MKTILETFKGVAQLERNKKHQELTRQFHDLARMLIFGGYFLINKTRRIHLKEIEFYYHEEMEGGLKDPVMYHTTDHEKRQDLPYFVFGSFNCHASGIDITFENKDKKYRASFLIRGYKVESLNDGEWVTTKDFERRSTYIYEDMMMGLSLDKGLCIEWVNEATQTSHCLTSGWRRNVASYLKDKNGCYLKDSKGNYIKEEISIKEYNGLGKAEKEKYFLYSGRRFKKCDRAWNFRLADNEENR